MLLLLDAWVDSVIACSINNRFNEAFTELINGGSGEVATKKTQTFVQLAGAAGMLTTRPWVSTCGIRGDLPQL